MQFVFTDIEGSTRLWHEHGDAMAQVLLRHNALAADAVASHGGRLIKQTGDGIFAVFEGRGLAFGVDFQHRIGAEPWGGIEALAVKIGVAAGHAQRWADDFFGPAVNRAARLAEAAWGGQIVVTAGALAEGPLPRGVEVIDLGLHAFGDLGEPERILQIRPPGGRADFPPLKPSAVRPHTVPRQTTPFIGREVELAELRALLTAPECRLLTLVGFGGVGKTRLAIQLAESLASSFAWGACFVPLAAATEGVRLASLIAERLRFPIQPGASPEDQLLRYLADKELLLILDNFEHVMPECSFVERLHSACSRVKLLVTSREGLLIEGERVFEVAGMSCPKGDDDVAFEEYDAPKLFIESARRHDRSFVVGLAEREVLLAICRAVEGLPLALELAASWVSVLGLAGVADRVQSMPLRLEHRLRGVPDRHRTLGAVLDYSYRLLMPKEQAAFRALSVFGGSFALEAAREIAGIDESTLCALVDKSLVARRAPGRFEMHELSRQHAHALLCADPHEAAGVIARMRRYFASFLSRLASTIHTQDDAALRHAMDEEIENILVVWHEATHDRDADTIWRFLRLVYRYFRIPGRDAEGEALFAAAVASLESAEGSPEVTRTLAGLRIRLGHFLALEERYRDAFRLLRRGLREARRSGLHDEIALAMQTLGRLWLMQGKVARSRLAFELSLAWWRRTGDLRATAIVLASLGHLAAAVGDYEKACALHVEAVEVSSRVGFRRLSAYALRSLGVAQSECGRLDEARATLGHALQISREDGEPGLVSGICDSLGEAYLAMGRFADARSLLEESMRIRTLLGDKALIACTAGRLATNANMQGAHESARTWAQVGIDAARELHHKAVAVECRVQAAWASVMLDGPDVAAALLRGAIDEAIAENDLAQHARALLVAAMILRRRGQCARAVEVAASVARDPPDHFARLWAADLVSEWRAVLPAVPSEDAQVSGSRLDWRTLDAAVV